MDMAAMTPSVPPDSPGRIQRGFAISLQPYCYQSLDGFFPVFTCLVPPHFTIHPWHLPLVCCGKSVTVLNCIYLGIVCSAQQFLGSSAILLLLIILNIKTNFRKYIFCMLHAAKV